ncbi:alpha-mannosidase [Salipaludibacillus sp. LMS25]|uniref:alpha-mannosidase n=1 Tax=Salipaludibacillus sp. LMS25 TaxID=2924031 RepID=UPI0020D03E55|nr:alpha-mannosidase [Salipaludibacillus sp. LMS25]UTR13523.1 alpha-mannosidase [Salipaludibacillus sp. LMS25]
MMQKKTAHIISHSHWDREWYMSLEEHRYYLIKLFDDLLEKLGEDANFHSFHLDGQTIMVDDYLEVRPEKEVEVKKYIREGRLIIGPWYILQDAFLTSSEANVRNLLYGMKTTKAFGQEGNLGYYPDTFGIYGQAPQLLKQAKIDVAAFGRGVTPTGFNNQVFHQDSYSSPYSELNWESPDGSSILGVLFANWYSNGNEIPVETEKAKEYWEKKLTESEKFAATSKLLYMNGCDHQPLQKNVTDAIKVANELFPEVEFKHSSFQQYIEEVKEELPEILQTIRGELRNQKTDGWSTLVNTASSRIYLKQANDRCQTLLERVLEPLGLLISDKKFHQDFAEYYWKLLMENHPHDSICGCSVDSVHREMTTRFSKVEKGALKFVEEEARGMATAIDTIHEREDAIPLVVFQTAGIARAEVIKKKVAVKKIYFDEINFKEIPEKLKGEILPSYILERADHSTVPVTVKDLGVNFGYDLPHDRFRRPYYAREIEVTFLYHSSNTVGYERCFLVPTEQGNKEEEEAFIWKEDETKLENENILVQFHDNGSYTLVDKRSGLEYKQLGMLEDTGDIGNEYMFKASGDGTRVTTENSHVTLNVLENTRDIASIEVTTSLSLPKEADERLKLEKENLVWHSLRKAGRSEEVEQLIVKSVMTLERKGEGLKVKMTMNNRAKDHRVRVLFPIGKSCSHHYADSIYELVKRPNKPESQWLNPSFDHHMQRFVSLNNSEKGLTVAGKGLHEYEINDDNTIALTVLRSVGELGDWGVFDTPEAQCLGENEAEYMVIPHQKDILSSGAYLTAYHYPLTSIVIQTNQKKGSASKVKELFTWEGDKLVMTACKPSLDGVSMVMRWFNPGGETEQLFLKAEDDNRIYRSTILEDKLDLVGEGTANIKVKPYEIVTLLIEASRINSLIN